MQNAECNIGRPRYDSWSAQRDHMTSGILHASLCDALRYGGMVEHWPQVTSGGARSVLRWGGPAERRQRLDMNGVRYERNDRYNLRRGR
jgi:hypothetical protein